MAETNQGVKDERVGSANGIDPGNGAAGVDPFAHLHKMSTTAGVMAQEYVAISPIAVWSLVLGLASFLVFLSDTLIVVPVAAAVCSIAALRQIGRSNGTMAGRLPAVGGLLLAIAAGGAVVGYRLNEAANNRADETRITALLQSLEKNLVAEAWDAAYKEQFSTRFQERVTGKDFSLRWKMFHDSPFFGAIKALSWSGRALFETEGSSRIAVALVQFELAKEKKAGDPPSNPLEMVFRKEGQEWKVDNVPFLFNQGNNAGGAGGPQGAPAGPGGTAGPPGPG